MKRIIAIIIAALAVAVPAASAQAHSFTLAQANVKTLEWILPTGVFFPYVGPCWWTNDRTAECVLTFYANPFVGVAGDAFYVAYVDVSRQGACPAGTVTSAGVASGTDAGWTGCDNGPLVVTPVDLWQY